MTDTYEDDTPENSDVSAFRSKLMHDLFIDVSDLSSEFSSQAIRFAQYAMDYEISCVEEDEAKADVASVAAQLDAQVRMDMTQGGAKITEKKVENTVITSPIYNQALTKHLDAKRRAGMLKAARDAFAQRKDMLVQLGATQRAEAASTGIVG